MFKRFFNWMLRRPVREPEIFSGLFPESPVVGDVALKDGYLYVYDGEKWNLANGAIFAIGGKLKGSHLFVAREENNRWFL